MALHVNWHASWIAVYVNDHGLGEYLVPLGLVLEGLLGISCIRQASRESGALNRQQSVGLVKRSLVMDGLPRSSSVNSVKMAQQKGSSDYEGRLRGTLGSKLLLISLFRFRRSHRDKW